MPIPPPGAPVNMDEAELLRVMRQQADDIWHLPGHQDCARTLADYANRVEGLLLQRAQATIPHLQALVAKWRDAATAIRGLAHDRASSDTFSAVSLLSKAKLYEECADELEAALLSAIPDNKDERR